MLTCYYTSELHPVNSLEVVRLLSDIFIYLLIVLLLKLNKLCGLQTSTTTKSST